MRSPQGMTTRRPMSGPWNVVVGDVVLLVTDGGDRYVRVVGIRRGRVSRAVLGVTSADGQRYTVTRGARLEYHYDDGRSHVGGVGLFALLDTPRKAKR